MEITEKCHNSTCGKPNIIDTTSHYPNRAWRGRTWCGWCGTEYKRNEEGNLVVKEIHNNHKDKNSSDIKSYRRRYYKKSTERIKEKLRKEVAVLP